MALLLELPPELEKRLTEEAAKCGQAPTEFIRVAVEEKLESAAVKDTIGQQKARNAAALALLRQWRQEDRDDPDLSPAPEIPSLSLREVKVD